MGGAPIAGGPTGRAPTAGPLGPGGRAPGRPLAVGAENPASNKTEDFSIVSNCKMQPGPVCSPFSTFQLCVSTNSTAMPCRPEAKYSLVAEVASMGCTHLV